MPFTLASFLVVSSWGGVNPVFASHAGSVGSSVALQVPCEECTKLVIWVVPDGSGGWSTLTVKVLVTSAAAVVLAAGTGTFWVQAVPAGEGGGPLAQFSQPSPSPAKVVLAGTLSVRVGSAAAP